jgi:hypothetical protein
MQTPAFPSWIGDKVRFSQFSRRAPGSRRRKKRIEAWRVKLRRELRGALFKRVFVAVRSLPPGERAETASRCYVAL